MVGWGARVATDSRWDWTGSDHEFGLVVRKRCPSVSPEHHAISARLCHTLTSFWNSLVGMTGTPRVWTLEAQAPQPSPEAASVWLSSL